MPREILSHGNALIKRIRSLRDKKHRREEGLFLAEGLRILTEAAETGRLPRYLVHAADARAHPLVQRLTDATEAAGGEVIETSRDILHKLSGKENPQSVLGVYDIQDRSEEHTSELQSLMRISYAVFCLKKKKYKTRNITFQHKPTST